MYRYAQIDSNGYVISDSHLSGEVTADNMIPISDDFDLTNKKYVNGKWVEYTPAPEPEEKQLTEIEEAILDTQANMEYLLCITEIGV